MSIGRRRGCERKQQARGVPGLSVGTGPGMAAVLLALLWAATPILALAQGIPTSITVRVVAHDAKIIGSGVGGAVVSIRDASNGELLARGLQEGGTGDTNLIMREPWPRAGARFDTEGAAGFTASLDLQGPTVVEILAEAPMGRPPEERFRASRTMLLLPGHHVAGEGVILELQGFTVEILEPSAQAEWSGTVTARVTMLCGCPTEPGGLWDSDRFSIWAEFVSTDGERTRVDLRFTGEPSRFEGRLEGVAGPGVSGELTVYATDDERGNFGMGRRTMGR